MIPLNFPSENIPLICFFVRPVLRFGEPPYVVRIALTFLSAYEPFPIMVTLTDLDEMPQAVWMFLTMFDEGYYDNMNAETLLRF